jgi:hypothetical protein
MNACVPIPFGPVVATRGELDGGRLRRLGRRGPKAFGRERVTWKLFLRSINAHGPGDKAVPPCQFPVFCSFAICASSSSCSAQPMKKNRIISTVRNVGFRPVHKAISMHTIMAR